MKKLALTAAAAVGIVVAPAQAKHSPPPAPQKCVAHAEAYVASGTLESGSLTATGKGVYSGTLTVLVGGTNAHAKADKGQHRTYTLSGVKVDLHHADPSSPAAGSRVHLQGTITTLARHCNQAGFTPAVTISKAEIGPPRRHH